VVFSYFRKLTAGGIGGHKADDFRLGRQTALHVLLLRPLQDKNRHMTRRNQKTVEMKLVFNPLKPALIFITLKKSGRTSKRTSPLQRLTG
jgi:hypothetical protein